MYINLANIDFGGEGGGKAVLQETTIESLLTETTKVVTPPEGVDGFNKVTVTHAPVETLTEATITSNGETTITPSNGYDATFGVKVSVDVTTPVETWTDVDGMKYALSTISKLPDGLKLAPRTGKNCEQMFSGCREITTVPLFDTSNVTLMGYMFNGCREITTVPLFDTSKVTDMRGMFSECSKLTTVPLFDTSKVTDMGYMFYSCGQLTTLGGFTELKVDFNLADSPNLTKESILNVINEAADVTASPKTLTLGETNLAKLTDEEKSIATNKGWTLA